MSGHQPKGDGVCEQSREMEVGTMLGAEEYGLGARALLVLSRALI